MTPFSPTGINVTPGTYEFDVELYNYNSAGFGDVRNLTVIFTNYNPDSNANNISDAWELKNFGALTPADGDPDKDGMNNLMEFALNTDPKKATENPAVCGFEVIGGQKYLCMTFPKNPNATNINYTVESSQNLQTWLPDTIPIITTATQQKVQSALSVTQAPQMFLRIKVAPK